MARLLFVLGIVAAVFWVYSIADCATFDRRRVRGLSKGWWIAVVLLLPVIGGVLWFFIGRGRRSAPTVRPARSVAPDDDLDFLRRLETDAAADERIRKLEQELADLDDETRRKRGDSPEPPRANG
ncbi:PLD nuclease N-terminal domain-containing protein [Agromyces archimandritae]|uniref:PLDc_N domain-containing protein n=1 Tax=Agromyces archimandritae TaxID=2781962 RepID=A0A975FKG7_9MICO|nr:PLD nuclease N-terminal domain-containing protein [Agromyces archimandritae]QTX03629.1 PLDc_N domain-containing protein [Agromyces archimandritae]